MRLEVHGQITAVRNDAEAALLRIGVRPGQWPMTAGSVHEQVEK